MLLGSFKEVQAFLGYLRAITISGRACMHLHVAIFTAPIAALGQAKDTYSTTCTRQYKEGRMREAFACAADI